MKHRSFGKLAAFLLVIAAACQSPSTEKPAAGPVSPPEPIIPLLRDSVQAKPVASHSERTDNPLNDWYFKVELYETPQTFQYLVKLQFEEITGTDTLRLPNFGTWPRPVIHRGDSPYSCIIGFLDKDDQFREYKKAWVKNNVLKLTTLKTYSVYSLKQSKKKDSMP